jgi:diketogulonate reductase-like aldo/keto reductase
VRRLFTRLRHSGPPPQPKQAKGTTTAEAISYDLQQLMVKQLDLLLIHTPRGCSDVSPPARPPALTSTGSHVTAASMQLGGIHGARGRYS